MSEIYRISGWAEHFETDETRKRDSLRWVPVPNKHDGLGFRMIAAQRNACELLAAWTLMLQLASKAKRGERGRLIRDGHPLTPDDMAIMTGFPKDAFERALKFFSQPKVNWIALEASPELPAGTAVGTGEIPVASDPAAQSAGAPADDAGPPARREGKEENGKKGIELKEGEGADAPPPPDDYRTIVGLWNLSAGLSKVQAITEQRKAAAKARLGESFFGENWRAAIAKLAASSFCSGDNTRGWKADFDWFLKPGTVVKIIEGKYDTGTRPAANTSNGF